VALDAGYVSEAEFASTSDLAEKCSRQLTRFMNYLEAHPRAVREAGVEYETGVTT
jgi:hypothetical protein